MKLKLAAVCSATLLAFAAASAPVFAGTLTWNFDTLAGAPAQPGLNLGTPMSTFTEGSLSMTAESVTLSGSMNGSSWTTGTADLYAKNGGSAAEQGLGLTGDPLGDNEIYYPNGIELTGFSGHISDVTISSIQGTSTNGETWAVYGSNNGTTWTQLGSGMGGLIENFSPTSLMSYSNLIISDPSGTPYTNSNDILLSGVTTTTSTVPEPGSLALFGAGLLGCALFLARRRRATQG